MGILQKLFGGGENGTPAISSAANARLARLRDRADAIEQSIAAIARPAPARAPWEVPGVAGPPPRPVVLARKPRVRDGDWTHSKSWFGGLPKLGGAPWPRGSDGRPLPFAAQISLAEIAAACPESPLPRAGWLAFFLNEGAVLHLADGELEPAPAPEDLPPAYCEGGYPLPERHSHTSRQLFPYWPVEPIGLPLPEDLRVYADCERHEEIWEMQHQLLAQQIPPRQYSFSVYSAREAGIEGADRLWWYGALHVQEKLRDALDGAESAVALRNTWVEQARDYQSRLAAEMPVDVAKIETSRAGEQRHRDQIPEIRRQAAGLEAFLAEYERFTAHRSAWEEMTEEDIARLKELMQIARKNFRDLTTYHIPSGIDAVRDVCIRRMITGDQQAFGALPDPLLSFINEKYRLTTQSPHQVFGLAGVKQDDLYDNLENLLLLQLSYDDLNEWQFGDMGLWHFWISPSDAAAGRWERSKLTFEAS